MIARTLKLLAAGLALTVLGGCVAPKTVDYSAYKQARPKTILVLPPLNTSPDVKASYSLLSQVTFPLAEAGYYVLPIALVDETFRQNGLTTPDDIHQAPPSKLKEIFGADAALYITVTEYGTRYMVISSETAVTATAKLVDLKSGTTLWTGSARASSEEGGNSGAGGLDRHADHGGGEAGHQQRHRCRLPDRRRGEQSSALGRTPRRPAVRPTLAEVRH
jgi:hypothetical protein